MSAIKDGGLLHAAKGARGDLDAWLEVHNEDEVRAAILTLADRETLRDEFAAKAMQGFCAASDPMKVADLLPDIAICAYRQADEMLAAREAQS